MDVDFRHILARKPILVQAKRKFVQSTCDVDETVDSFTKSTDDHNLEEA